jgi:hypothetical protein
VAFAATIIISESMTTWNCPVVACNDGGIAVLVDSTNPVVSVIAAESVDNATR